MKRYHFFGEQAFNGAFSRDISRGARYVLPLFCLEHSKVQFLGQKCRGTLEMSRENASLQYILVPKLSRIF
jgi:hypothetical protein